MIRKAKKEDLKQLSAVYDKAFPVHNIFTQSEEIVINYLEPLLDSIMVVEVDNKIVGGLVIFEKNYGDWKLTNFKHIAISPEYQGEGIGSELLKEAEKIVKTGKIELRVTEAVSEQGTIKFYEKNGYEKEAELKSHYQKGEICFVMGKVLQ